MSTPLPAGPARPAPSRPPARPGGGLRVARILGIDIELDPSLALIFALVVYSLGAHELAAWHPDWSPALRWLTAVTAGVLFFASLLGHELSHSMVARHYGIRVPRIRLFLFGGQAEIEREPPHPGAEFWMAIAGPAFSLALGVACMGIAQVALGERGTAMLASEPRAALATLGFAPTILLWLGSVNVVLAVFNMVPGFPLDGGRVLRATVWWFTGDRARATRWAAGAGRFFGFAMMAFGAWTVLAAHEVGGFWYVLMGWFLSHLASASGQQERLHSALDGVRVAQVMRTHFEKVDADLPLAHFIDTLLMRSAQPLWPVLRHGEVVGAIGLEQLGAVDAAARARTTVAGAMLPLERVPSLTPGEPAERLLTQAHATALVFEGTQLVGMAGAADALKRIALA